MNGTRINKAKTNLAKHGVSFEEATTACADALSLTMSDPLHSSEEDRFVLIGTSANNRLLIVVHAERNDHIRIISVRKTTKAESKYYEHHAG